MGRKRTGAEGHDHGDGWPDHGRAVRRCCGTAHPDRRYEQTDREHELRGRIRRFPHEWSDRVRRIRGHYCKGRHQDGGFSEEPCHGIRRFAGGLKVGVHGRSRGHAVRHNLPVDRQSAGWCTVRGRRSDLHQNRDAGNVCHRQRRNCQWRQLGLHRHLSQRLGYRDYSCRIDGC